MHPKQGLVGLACVGIVAAAVSSGCAVGPDYRVPELPTADRWHALPEEARPPESDVASLAAWWTALGDPMLTQLIEQAVSDNRSVHAAHARVLEARARRGAAAGGFWPSASASTGVSRTSSDAVSGQSNLNPSDPDQPDAGVTAAAGDETYTAGLDTAWELDLFGGQRRAFEAASAQLAASEADLRDVLVTLLGDLALAYTNVRTTQARLDYSERNLKAQREVYEITQWRADAGLATTLDVEQARASYEQTRAQIPALESSLQQTINRLAVLTGQAPGALSDMLEERRPIPLAPADVVTGVPADVIRRRPDIRRAERLLAAQTAQVGVATAALYPSLTLGGAIGLTAFTGSELFADAVSADRVGATLSLPVFRGGALRHNLAAQNALVDQALANYESTVLAALEEVENALIAWSNEQRRHAALVEAARSARIAYELGLLRYNSGLVDFQTVLTADRTLISVEDQLAVSSGELTSSLIRLYKALGGGWSVFPDAR